MDREREPLPTRVPDTPDLPAAYARRPRRRAGGLDGPRPGRDGPRGHRRPRPPAADLDPGDQPDRGPRSAGARRPSTSWTAWPAVAPLRARGVDRCSTWAPAAGCRASRWPSALPARDALLVEPIGKKARFLATAVEATGLAGDDPGRRRPAPRPSPPTRGIADAGRRSRRGPSAPWPSSSSWPSRCWPRAGSWWPGSAATWTRELAGGATGDRSAWVAAGPRGRRSGRARAARAPARRRHPDRGRAGRLPARSGGAQAPPVVTEGRPRPIGRLLP